VKRRGSGNGSGLGALLAVAIGLVVVVLIAVGAAIAALLGAPWVLIGAAVDWRRARTAGSPVSYGQAFGRRGAVLGQALRVARGRRGAWVACFAAGAVAIVGVAALTSAASRRSSAAPQADSAVANASHRPRHHVGNRRHRRTVKRRHRRHPTGDLPFSRASADVVQPQPPPGSCHARGSGPYALPDPACTPGALNPAVTQSTIAKTICVSGWSETVRPSESVTEPEKQASMSAYGDSGSLGDYEYDHLVPLELGGAVNDPRNLWPEPGASPNPKDAVEDALHRTVCDGGMALAAAQQIIVKHWVAWAKSNGYGTSPAPQSQPSTSTPAPGGSPNKPIADVNCSDFPTHAAAQHWFAAQGGSPTNDVAGLDGDHDGIACESLP
jgi:hypothetical protein